MHYWTHWDYMCVFPFFSEKDSEFKITKGSLSPQGKNNQTVHSLQYLIYFDLEYDQG